MSNRSPVKKHHLGVILTIFAFASIFGSLFTVLPARAQSLTAIITDLPRMAAQIITKIQEGLKVAVITAAQKGVSYFLRQLAYDSAVWLASGGKGQKPLAYTGSFGSYMENVAGNAFGEAIGELGKPFGLNLCNVPDIKVDLAIKIGLRDRFDQGGVKKEYSCSWNEFKKGWGEDAWRSRYGSQDALQKQFNIALKADSESDLGIYLQSAQRIEDHVSNRTAAAVLERQEGQGFKPLTAIISGDIKTPAQATKKSAEDNTASEQSKKSEQQIGAAIGAGTFQILPSTLSLFLNTLTSQMLKNFQQKGMLPFGACIGGYGGEECKNSGNGEGVISFEGEGVNIGGRAAAQAAFSEFLVANIRVEDNFKLLAQLENCPDAPGLYNCRADGYLVQAVQEAGYGNPVTIAEALKKRWIHPDWKLLSDERPENLDPNCRENAYCYANIKVLRQVRILPLGFEIAALRSDPDSPWTVQQVVDGFYDCNPNGAYDPVNYPFCHLIDPNWVLKIEPMRCNASVNSAQPLMNNAPDRLEDCADLSGCVAYNKDGTCLTYGYCAREKNVWRFDADKCDAQFSTCKTFTNTNGQSVSYLYRTLNTAFCDQNTAGCTAYSLNQDSAGNWLAPSFNQSSVYYNNGIHFNNKVSTACGSNSLGCSAFKDVTGANLFYLHKAPDYLKCYDANPATLAVEWPRNNADLSRLRPRPECSAYAGVCTELELGCNLFTSSLTGEQIPGKFTSARLIDGQLVWNDQCDAKCDGYDAYREMPNNYSNGRNIADIIPASGRACQAADEGCTGFTNMGAVLDGGEQVEYFSYLRPCIKPDTAKQKNFYTYEGNQAGGYQLKKYTLEKDLADGSPKYWFRTPADLTVYNNKCNEAVYQAGLADPDCRQFNDEAGRVYYRLLAQTIAVHERCTYYRLNKVEFAATPTGVDPICFQNGEYKNGFCYYYGLPALVSTNAGASRTCAATANSCFAYKGNAANNVKQILKDDFERRETTPSEFGWSAGTDQLIISTESTHYGEHSLYHAGIAALSRDLTGLTVGRSYSLTFWAKGNRNNVNVQLVAGERVNNVGTVNTTDAWQYYSFSPVELAGSTTSARLVFIDGDGVDLFLDNVRLVEITDYLYLVRDSLRVDPVCDSNLNDNLPGEALGCAAYMVTGVADPFYLTNFSYLCRNAAIGCSALIDTYNTLNTEQPEAYNIWLPASTPGTKTITVGGQNFSCVVPTGEIGCYVNITGFDKTQIMDAGGRFVTSTVFLPADTPSSSPVYLVLNQSASCNQSDLGCTLAGTQIFAATSTAFATITIKNDPALYQENLCQAEAVGCNAYSLGGGSYYFKDPAVLGQRICEYRSNGVSVNGVLSYGWFRKDTVNTPCYPDYLQVGNNYGLWSFGDTGKYQNLVGECPSTQTGCTEFVDRSDRSVGTENGRPYYFIYNNKISSGDCDGLASQKYGCVLFDQTDRPGKLWDTGATYLLSERNDSQKVAPVDNTAVKDANILIKVKRDRECGEWLQCQSSHRIWDETLGKWRQVCDQIGRCDRAPSSAQEDNITNCAHFTDAVSNQYFGQVLTPELYQNRDVSWKGMDFSGYSLLNMYQPEELTQFNIGSESNPDWRLVKLIACGGGDNCQSRVADDTDYACRIGVANGAACGRGNIGKCYNKLCVVNHLGTGDFSGNNATFTGVNTKLKAECRAYPEITSPFPFTAKINRSAQFSGVNYCNENNIADDNAPGAYNCECDYTKVTYGDDGYLTKYFDYYRPNRSGAANIPNSGTGGVPSGICQGGDKDGYACVNNGECSGGGVCQKKTKEKKLLGWKGYCLESDFSRNIYADPNKFACLSWLPVGTLAGYADIDNQYIDAGYVSAGRSNAVCLQGNGGGQITPQDANDPFVITTRNENYSLYIHTGVDLGVAYLVNNNNYEYDNNQAARAYYAASPTSIDLSSAKDEMYWRQSEIDYFKFTIPARPPSGILLPLGMVVDSRDEYDPSIGTSVYVYPNYPLPAGGGAYVSLGTSHDGSITNGLYAVGYYLGKKNMPAFVFGDTRDGNGYVGADGSLSYDAPDSNHPGAYVSGNIFSNNFSIGQTAVPARSLGIFDPAYSLNSICPGGQSSNGNWHVVVMEFDENTEVFQGYRLFYCDESGGDGTIAYTVTARLRETCRSVASTVFDGGDYTSAPWTDRLWEKRNYPTFPVPFNTFRSPFGGTRFDSSQNLVYLSYPKFSGYNSNNCRNGFDCESYDQLATRFNEGDRTFISAGAGGYPLARIRGDSAGYYVTSTNAATAEPIYVRANNSTNIATAQSALLRLFARVPGVYDYDFRGNAYAPLDINNLHQDFNITESATNLNKAPRVRPVGVGTDCGASDVCREIAQDGMTINETWNQDVVIQTSPARAVMKFYAFADANQMPLRSIRVNWDDGTNGYRSGPSSFFRNKRGPRDGVCDRGDCSLDGVIYTDRPCANDNDCKFLSQCVSEDRAPNFGLIAGRTCDNNYYLFDHVYTCVMGDEVQHWTDNCPNSGLQSRYGGCCVYKPKVQVKDNWGWCNGRCGSEASAGGEGCYDWNNFRREVGVVMENECEYIDADAWTCFGNNCNPNAIDSARVLVAPVGSR